MRTGLSEADSREGSTVRRKNIAQDRAAARAAEIVAGDGTQEAITTAA